MDEPVYRGAACARDVGRGEVVAAVSPAGQHGGLRLLLGLRREHRQRRRGLSGEEALLLLLRPRVLLQVVVDVAVEPHLDDVLPPRDGAAVRRGERVVRVVVVHQRVVVRLGEPRGDGAPQPLPGQIAQTLQLGVGDALDGDLMRRTHRLGLAPRRRAEADRAAANAAILLVLDLIPQPQDAHDEGIGRVFQICPLVRWERKVNTRHPAGRLDWLLLRNRLSRQNGSVCGRTPPLRHLYGLPCQFHRAPVKQHLLGLPALQDPLDLHHGSKGASGYKDMTWMHDARGQEHSRRVWGDLRAMSRPIKNRRAPLARSHTFSRWTLSVTDSLMTSPMPLSTLLLQRRCCSESSCSARGGRVV